MDLTNEGTRIPKLPKRFDIRVLSVENGREKEIGYGEFLSDGVGIHTNPCKYIGVQDLERMIGKYPGDLNQDETHELLRKLKKLYPVYTKYIALPEDSHYLLYNPSIFEEKTISRDDLERLEEYQDAVENYNPRSKRELRIIVYMDDSSWLPEGSEDWSYYF